MQITERAHVMVGKPNPYVVLHQQAVAASPTKTYFVSIHALCYRQVHQLLIETRLRDFALIQGKGPIFSSSNFFGPFDEH